MCLVFIQVEYLVLVVRSNCKDCLFWMRIGGGLYRWVGSGWLSKQRHQWDVDVYWAYLLSNKRESIINWNILSWKGKYICILISWCACSICACMHACSRYFLFISKNIHTWFCLIVFRMQNIWGHALKRELCHKIPWREIVRVLIMHIWQIMQKLVKD